MKNIVKSFLEEVNILLDSLSPSLPEVEYNNKILPVLNRFVYEVESEKYSTFPHSVIFSLKNEWELSKTDEKDEAWNLFFERAKNLVISKIESDFADQRFVQEKRIYSEGIKLLFKIEENFYLIFQQKIMVNKIQSDQMHAYSSLMMKYMGKLRDLEQQTKESLEQLSNIQSSQAELEASHEKITATNSDIQYSQEGIYSENGNILSKYKETTESQKKILKTQEEITKSQKDSQKEFVTILGIFTTIIFAAFGGIQLLSGILKDTSEAKIVPALINGSFVFISIVIILSLLFSGISHMTSLPIKSCGCKQDEKCNCTFRKKHPTIFYSLLLVIILLPFVSLSRYISMKSLITSAISVNEGINYTKLKILFEISIFSMIPAFIFVTFEYVIFVVKKILLSLKKLSENLTIRLKKKYISIKGRLKSKKSKRKLTSAGEDNT